MGHQQEKRPACRLARKDGQKIEAGFVTPVQILKDEQARMERLRRSGRCGRQIGDQAKQGPPQPLFVGFGVIQADGRCRGRTQRRRQLPQFAGRFAQFCTHFRHRVERELVVDQAEQRTVGNRAFGLIAAGLHHPEPGGGGLASYLRHEPGFANTCLAADGCQLAVAGPGLFQLLQQLPALHFPANHDRTSKRLGACAGHLAFSFDAGIMQQPAQIVLSPSKARTRPPARSLLQ